MIQSNAKNVQTSYIFSTLDSDSIKTLLGHGN